MIKVTYTKELLEKHVKTCFSFAEVLRKIGLKPVGGNYRTIQIKLKEFNIDYSHFTGKGWNKPTHPKFACTGQKLSAVLSTNSSITSSKLKLRLFNHKLKENKCELCGISKWLGKPITCELHHINGDWTDNRLDNLQILCPNCHSQTDNFRNKKVLSAQNENSDVEAG